MKKITLTLFAALFFLMQSVNGQGINSQKEVLDEIDEFILEQMEILHVPGLSACIVIGDSVAWHNNYGYMNLEDSLPVHDSTLFNVFSIGKTVTTACVMQLWDEQLLGLEQNINDFIPFQVINPHNGLDSITPRMIMSHTSSIRDWMLNNYVVLGDPTESLAFFTENYFDPDGSYYIPNNYYNLIPGTNFHYSNFGTALLGYLVEPLMGTTFNEYAYNSLLNPLEMNSSAWFLNELNMDNLAIGYTYSNGSFLPNDHYGIAGYPGVALRSTTLELANFNIMLLNGGLFNNVNILSNEAVDSMTTVQNPNWQSGYGPTGLGMFKTDYFGDRIVWGHYGGGSLGYAGHFHFCPEENTGVVVLTNSEQWLDDLVEYLFDYALLITNVSDNIYFTSDKISIYPNPINNISTIEIELKENEEFSLSLFNINGQMINNIYQGVRSDRINSFKLDFSKYSPGIYFIKLQTSNGIITQKIIKK